ncbi:MAG: hypothetical protein ICV66_04720 [Chitinophagaceae bacterium]|nr:hypothetical protein [Chitinophagaceae bacterium]
MKIIAALLICIGVIVMACNKDKFQTKPQLSIKSINSSRIPAGGTLVVTLKYTDKEGDVDDSLLIVRERTNERSTTPPTILPFEIPEFPNEKQGELQVALDYNFALTFALPPIRIPGSDPERYEPDTLNFKFVLRDQAGNKSDTARLNSVIVER